MLWRNLDLFAIIERESDFCCEVRELKPVIRAIAFDLDDTLLRDDRTISDETVSVLRRASEAGILILPASGRTYCSMAGFVARIGCANRVICANGAVIAQPDGTTLHELTIPADIARQVAGSPRSADATARRTRAIASTIISRGIMPAHMQKARPCAACTSAIWSSIYLRRRRSC